MTRPPPASTPSRYDAIVVGAGIAGLVAASELQRGGHRVLVLEHNHQAGGLMSGMRRRGFYFDVGCQSFEDMGIVFPLLEQYGLSDLAHFRRARYRLVMPGLDTAVESLPQTRRAFQEAFPESAAGFARAFALHERTSELVQQLFTPDRVPYVRDESPLALARWVARALVGAGAASPAGALRRLDDLRTWMLGDFTAWYERQLPPSGVRDLLSRCGYSHMNVFVASAFWHLWAHDYWYPEGGLQPWFDRWVARLRERGVRFQFKSTVTGLEKRGDRVTAVLTRKGERFEADEVVYCGDYRQAVHQLVGAERYPARDLASTRRHAALGRDGVGVPRARPPAGGAARAAPDLARLLLPQLRLPDGARPARSRGAPQGVPRGDRARRGRSDPRPRAVGRGAAGLHPRTTGSAAGTPARAAIPRASACRRRARPPTAG